MQPEVEMRQQQLEECLFRHEEGLRIPKLLETLPALHPPDLENCPQRIIVPAVKVLSGHDQYLALAGIRLHQILSAELFREKAGATREASLARLCRERWANLATVLAAMPQPIESYLVIRGPPTTDDGAIAFLAAARAADHRQAEHGCRHAWTALWSILQSSLDYVELQPIHHAATLERTVRRVSAGQLHHRDTSSPAQDGGGRWCS